MDDLCLSRAMELLEYWRREAVAIAKASGAKQQQPEIDVQEWREPSEEEIEMQFEMLPRANAQQIGVDQNISRIPPHLRQMIDWAEEMKAKGKVN